MGGSIKAIIDNILSLEANVIVASLVNTDYYVDSPGDYLLTVTSGKGEKNYDSYGLTIGAVGPKGEQGEPGDVPTVFTVFDGPTMEIKANIKDYPLNPYGGTSTVTCEDTEDQIVAVTYKVEGIDIFAVPPAHGMAVSYDLLQAGIHVDKNGVSVATVQVLNTHAKYSLALTATCLCYKP